MTNRDSARELEIPPRASVLVESVLDIGCSLPTAATNVMDNPPTAGVRVIEFLSATLAVGIVDDGASMTESELLDVIPPGSRSPHQNWTTTDVRRIRHGFPTARYWQCQRLTVAKAKEREVSCAGSFLDKVAAGCDRSIVERPHDSAVFPSSGHLVADGNLVACEKRERVFRPGSHANR